MIDTNEPTSDPGQARQLLMGDEAVALGALHAGVVLGTGYPGTPSTEILESFSLLGGRAEWAPNEKVAAEVALGVAFAGGNTLVTMKHVGLNVAADPFFTAAYTDMTGGFVLVSADDPGMASSQNEQDNRHYAVAAAVPTLEPCDSQEAYDFTRLAFELSLRWRIPVMLRLTTRICHSKTVVTPRPAVTDAPKAAFKRDIPGRVMIPAYARPAHGRLRAKVDEILAWNEAEGPQRRIQGDGRLGIITSGVSFTHVREAAPGASILKIGLSYPLPMETMKAFAASVERCVVIEEGDPYLVDAIRAAGGVVEGKPEMYRFGELNTARVRRILDGDTSPETVPPRGKPPELCPGCPHRSVFQILRDMGCIVAGDIGCYTLSVLPPFEAMDTCVCMGASIGVGLGMRHVLPAEEARRVVSVIGDSTFMHSGITGLVEMAYNPPATGHVVIILDNETTAMTGLQEHPGTGRSLDHSKAHKIDYETLARAIGIQHVHVLNPTKEKQNLEALIEASLAKEELTLIVAHRPCVLAAPKIRMYEEASACEKAGS
jgi:indolepyruvate ferredoxin oxidoreductase alpha subunit